MSYSQKKELVETSLISHCKKCVSENWERMFDMWLSCEADMEFGHGYIDNFKEQFGDNITENVESQLWFAGKNLIYSICTFMAVNNNCKLSDILDFIEKFISLQLEDFENDYDTTEWINSENSDNENHEDNPS